jgi:hypothetical protein
MQQFFVLESYRHCTVTSDNTDPEGNITNMFLQIIFFGDVSVPMDTNIGKI